MPRDATITAVEAEVANVKAPLNPTRTIGIALGIIMPAHKITPDEAFEVLRVTSRHSYRMVRDVADEVALTGIVPDTCPEARCG